MAAAAQARRVRGRGWDPEDHPESVLSGRTNDEVKADPDRIWRSDLPPAQASIALRPPAIAGPDDAELAALDALGPGGTWQVFGRGAAADQPGQGAVPRPGRRAAGHQARADPLRRPDRPGVLPYLAGRAAEHAPLPRRRRPSPASGTSSCPTTRPTGCRAGTTPTPSPARPRPTWWSMSRPRWCGRPTSARWNGTRGPRGPTDPDSPTYALIDIDPGEAHHLGRRAGPGPAAPHRAGPPRRAGAAQGDRPARHPDLGTDRPRAELRRHPRLGRAAVQDDRRRRARPGELEVGRPRAGRAWPGSTTPRTSTTRPSSRPTARVPRRARRSPRRSRGTSSTTRRCGPTASRSARCSTAWPRAATCSAPCSARASNCRPSTSPADHTPGRSCSWAAVRATSQIPPETASTTRPVKTTARTVRLSWPGSCPARPDPTPPAATAAALTPAGTAVPGQPVYPAVRGE